MLFKAHKCERILHTLNVSQLNWIPFWAHISNALDTYWLRVFVRVSECNKSQVGIHTRRCTMLDSARTLARYIVQSMVFYLNLLQFESAVKTVIFICVSLGHTTYVGDTTRHHSSSSPSSFIRSFHYNMFNWRQLSRIVNWECISIRRPEEREERERTKISKLKTMAIATDVMRAIIINWSETCVRSLPLFLFLPSDAFVCLSSFGRFY